MLLSDVGVGFGCPIPKQVRTRPRARGGYGHEVELLQQPLLRFPERLGRQKDILTLQGRETEAQPQLKNCFRSFQSQTTPTTVPAPARPPPCRSQIAFTERNCISAAVDGGRFSPDPAALRRPCVRCPGSSRGAGHEVALCDRTRGIRGAFPATREPGDVPAPLAGPGHRGMGLRTLSAAGTAKMSKCS